LDDLPEPQRDALTTAFGLAGGEPPGLDGLLVGGLSDEDARALLDSVIKGPLDERVRDRILFETRGNPLALLELPRGFTPAELAGGFGLLDAMPLAGRLEEGFLRRLEPLAIETRLLLLEPRARSRFSRSRFSIAPASISTRASLPQRPR
jgi:hypothetical protein